MIGAQEAARLLGVSRNTLTRLIKDGAVPILNPPSRLLKRARAYQFDKATILRLAAEMRGG